MVREGDDGGRGEGVGGNSGSSGHRRGIGPARPILAIRRGGIPVADENGIVATPTGLRDTVIEQVSTRLVVEHDMKDALKRDGPIPEVVATYHEAKARS